MRAPGQPRRSRALAKLLAEVRACQACSGYCHSSRAPCYEPTRPRAVLIVGQAPGTRVHATGIPWNDPSARPAPQLGSRSIASVFYDENRFAIIPVGYCYPGRGRSGDLPPRRECSELWLPRLLARLPRIELILLVGQYAQALYLGDRRKETLTEDGCGHFVNMGPRFVPPPAPLATEPAVAGAKPLVRGQFGPRAATRMPAIRVY